MEIKNNLTQCPQGHFYNAAIHSSCPICSSNSTIPFDSPADSAAAGAGSFPHTQPPAGAGNFNQTTPPPMGPAGGQQAGAGVDPFSRPTEIGGDDRACGDQAEPVVGWLVCIDGPVRGTDFRIHAGYNYIGREVGDIHIHGDLQISRQNHAMIAFDSSEGCYYVGPSAGRNLIKVNGKTVLNAVEIHNYDIISIGTTKLMFVALCGDHFSWNREVNQ